MTLLFRKCGRSASIQFASARGVVVEKGHYLAVAYGNARVARAGHAARPWSAAAAAAMRA